jgi:hypothetical protein
VADVFSNPEGPQQQCSVDENCPEKIQYLIVSMYYYAECLIPVRNLERR